ncbi:MAG: GTPase, partial [Planctomycetota bacterium]
STCPTIVAMQIPAPGDTIVAVSTGWQPSAVGIVRLSGPDAFRLAGSLLSSRAAGPAGTSTDVWPRSTDERLAAEPALELPATVFWFLGPRSYTGQDVAELHTVGSLPLLRLISAQLIAGGARRAWPGEFTARAYLARRLSAGQVDAVLSLIQAEHEADLRQAARAARTTGKAALAGAVEQLIDLLARLEAGIDFTEEEDVRFIRAPEVVHTLDAVLARLPLGVTESLAAEHSARPHVALVGLPNAGKSTLFNALLGYERALVAPVLGTTRDVLSARVDFGDMPAVVQDCAGLGASPTELELATHIATERAAEAADLVLWVHAADMPWEQRETETCGGLDPARVVLVWTKADLRPDERPAPSAMCGGRSHPGAERLAGGHGFADAAAVCALSGLGLPELRGIIARRLAQRTPAPDSHASAALPHVAAALARARGLAAAPDANAAPELIALELRVALDALAAESAEPIDEVVLGRIFARFCVGK